jgi:hypothetical protein
MIPDRTRSRPGIMELDELTQSTNKRVLPEVVEPCNRIV